MKLPNTPAFVLKHLITKNVSIKAELRDRYWFEWSARRDDGKLSVSVDLLDAEGNVIASARANMERTSEAKNKWVMIDTKSGLQPASFRYRTSKLLKSSEWAAGTFSGKTEDLAAYNYTP